MFFFLCVAVPTIWFLELYEMEKRIKERDASKVNVSDALANVVYATDVDNSTEDLHAKIAGLDVSAIRFNDIFTILYRKHVYKIVVDLFEKCSSH